MIIDPSHNTNEQFLLLNNSNNKIKNIEKEKEQQTNLRLIFQQNTQPRGKPNMQA